MPYEQQLEDGLSALRDGHADQAVVLLTVCAEERPTDPQVHRHLGVALSQAGRPGEAEAALDRAIELDPSDPRSHFEMGRLLRSQGRKAEAGAALRRVLELSPAHGRARLELAELARPQPRTGPPERAAGDADRGAALVRVEPWTVLRTLGAARVVVAIPYLLWLGRAIRAALAPELGAAASWVVPGALVFGALASPLLAALYNLYAARVGPLRLQLERRGEVCQARRIHPGGLCRLWACWMACLCVCVGFPMSAVMVLVSAGGMKAVGLAVALLLWALLLVVFTVFGALAGLIFAGLYNAAARICGGVSWLDGRAEGYGDIRSLRLGPTLFTLYIANLPYFALSTLRGVLSAAYASPAELLVLRASCYALPIGLVTTFGWMAFYNLFARLLGGLRFTIDEG